MNIFPHDRGALVVNPECIASGALPTAMYLLRLTLSRFSFHFQVYWHSSAHIMGEAMERVYGGCLCYGPPIENGFYYDMYLEEG